MFKIKFQNFFAYFWFQFSMLALTGIRFDFLRLKIQNRGLKVAYKLLCLYFIFIYGFNVISHLLTLFLVDQNIEQRIIFITILGLTIEIAVKTFYMFTNSKRLTIVLEFLEKSYKPSCGYLTKEAKIILIFTKIGFFLSTITGLKPFFITTTSLLLGKWTPQLIFLQWLPFDPLDIRFYFLAYLSQYTMGFFVIALRSGNDSIIMMIFAHINQQLILLAEEFSVEKTYKTVNLKSVVEKHCRIFE